MLFFLIKQKDVCKLFVIRSYEHNVFTLDINKIAFSAQDDKRICIKGFHDMTYQYGSPTLKRLIST